MADIITDAKAWLHQQPQRIQTHSENCHQWHATCLVRRLLTQYKRHCNERDALRVYCRDLMKQRDAALAKIAEMDADRPTAEELAAVREAGENWRHHSYTPYRDLGITLRALADRREAAP